MIDEKRREITMVAILKNRKGVTLVELLAVIVIMGIIAAIAVPAITGLIARQRENAAQASYEVCVEVAENYVDSEELVEDDTFTSTDLVTDGYLEADPFGALVTVTVGVGGAVSITAPADPQIDGISVPIA